MAKSTVSRPRAPKGATLAQKRTAACSPDSIIPAEDELPDGLRIEDGPNHELYVVGTSAMAPTLARLESYIFKRLMNEEPKDGDIVAAHVVSSHGRRFREVIVVRRYSLDQKSGLITLTADNTAFPDIVGKAPSGSNVHAKPVEIVAFAVLTSTDSARRRVAVNMGPGEKDELTERAARPEPKPEDVIPERLKYLFRHGSSFADPDCMPFSEYDQERNRQDFWALPAPSHVGSYQEGRQVGTLYGAAARIYAQRDSNPQFLLGLILGDMVRKGAENSSDGVRGISDGVIASILAGYRNERPEDIATAAYASIGQEMAIQTNWLPSDPDQIVE